MQLTDVEDGLAEKPSKLIESMEMRKLREIVEEVTKENEKLKARNSLLNRKISWLKNKYEKPNALDLPVNVWQNIFRFVSDNDIVNLSAVCSRLRCFVHALKSNFDFGGCMRLNFDYFMNYVLTETCTSLNINYCHWIKPQTILEVISRTKLQHLGVIKCQIDSACVTSICHLHLRSLSFLYTNEWHLFFNRHSFAKLPYLKHLTRLEIHFLSSLPETLDINHQTVLYHVFHNVLHLPYRQLEYLKIYEHFHFPREKLISSSISSVFTTYPPRLSPRIIHQEKWKPLPNLKSLIVDISCNQGVEIEVAVLLTLVLKNKVIPLSHVDFGRHTCYLLKNGFLRSPLVLKDESTLSLRNNKMKNYGFEGSMRSRASLKKIVLENLSVSNFTDFIRKIVKQSAHSLEQFVIKRSRIDSPALNGINLLAEHCHHITVLELDILDWLSMPERYYHDDKESVKNKALLKAISSFKYLKKLSIQPQMLQCHYYDWSENSIFLEEMPFGEVARECSQLSELRISNPFSNQNQTAVYEISLYDIALCKSLKKLCLSNFMVEGYSDFNFSDITKGCVELQEIKITEIYKSIGSEFTIIYEDFFIHTPNLKKLSIKCAKSFLTKTLSDNLSLCHNLEAIKLGFNSECEDEIIDHLLDQLPKIKKLLEFKLFFNKFELFKDHLNWVSHIIKKEKPAFFTSADIYLLNYVLREFYM